MNKRSNRPSISPSAASLQWTGLAILIAQIIYVTSTLISNYTTGIQTPYSLPAVYTMLGSMVVFAILIITKISIAPKGKSMGIGTIIIYYLSMILFTYCIYNVNRDGLLAVLWVILLATTGILYGRKAFTTGAMVMLIATVNSPIVVHYDMAHIVALILTLLMSTYASYLFYRYREIGLIELRSFNQLKRRERLQTRRLRAVVNNLKDALISVSSDGVIQLYNSAAMDLLNTNQDLMGAKVDKLFNLVDENGDPVKLSDVAKQAKIPSQRTDLRLSYGDNQFINLRLTIIPIKNQFSASSTHDLDGVIIMASDITKEKSLDDERDEFIGVVSHELRTPVAIAEGALSNLQLLLERDGDPKVFASTLDAAHKQILYLGQMVNDLSTLSRAQRGLYMDNEAINIHDFMNSLYNKYNQDATDRHLRLVVNIDATGTVSVPSMVIEEIMQNLVTNALKYTPKGSVTIGVEPVKGDKQHVRFYVRDTGIGISKSDQAHVFQRFWRSEDYRTRQTNGTGLGLHVVDQLAAKVGSKVELTSQLNHGSCFSIVLPLAPQN